MECAFAHSVDRQNFVFERKSLVGQRSGQNRESPTIKSGLISLVCLISERNESEISPLMSTQRFWCPEKSRDTSNGEGKHGDKSTAKSRREEQSWRTCYNKMSEQGLLGDRTRKAKKTNNAPAAGKKRKKGASANSQQQKKKRKEEHLV